MASQDTYHVFPMLEDGSVGHVYGWIKYISQPWPVYNAVIMSYQPGEVGEILRSVGGCSDIWKAIDMCVEVFCENYGFEI